MSQPHILIVEDSLTQKIILKAALENEGFPVAVAEDGAEAMEYIKNDDFPMPDLIISDIVMPNMDGYELCKTVRESYSSIFSILLTSNHDETALRKSFQAGAIDFLEKPFNNTELLLRVNNVLRIQKAENALKEAMGQLAQYNESLKTLSITDELTGLSNRRNLINLLKNKMNDAERYTTPLSIILFDIDHFKKINDNYGHLVGDEVLKKISSIFSNNIRKTDIAGRYGGEEFLIILPNTPLEAGINIGRKINKLIKDLTFKSMPDKQVTISGGVCGYKNETKCEDFLVRVDDLLYAAKDNGRDRIEFKYKIRKN